MFVHDNGKNKLIIAYTACYMINKLKIGNLFLLDAR